MQTSVRRASRADATAINRIYNHYVRTSTCTWHLTEETDDGRRKWIESRGGLHPVLVAESGGEVVGWGSLSVYNSRQGWDGTVEDSVFIDHRHQGRGLGKLILGRLIEEANRLGHRVVVARISGEQTASIRLHASLGFTEAGRLRGVGRKFGQTLDCIYMQKDLGQPLAP
jgi:phosphinothricin acetyltransferase